MRPRIATKNRRCVGVALRRDAVELSIEDAVKAREAIPQPRDIRGGNMTIAEAAEA